MSVCKLNRSNRSGGFALMQTMVSLGIVTLVLLAIVSLSRQLNFMKSNSQKSIAVLDLQNRSNSLLRDPQAWLTQINKSGSSLASCLSPAPGSSYSCPGVDQNLLTSDAGLSQRAGSMFASSVEIPDIDGRPLAGTVNNPVLLNADGSACTTNCPLKSTGYFLRENSSLSSDPGNVSVIVKIESNNNNSASKKASTPFKTQYFQISLGQSWKNNPVGSAKIQKLATQLISDVSSGGSIDHSLSCPKDSVMIGFFNDGTARCINTNQMSCSTGTLYKGNDESGHAICEKIPTCKPGESASLTDSGVVCQSSSPCDAGEVFLGYFNGGETMCSALTNLKCDAGKFQVGLKNVDGSTVAADCAELPADAAKCVNSSGESFLKYKNNKFECLNFTTADLSHSSSCATGEYAKSVSYDSDGKIVLSCGSVTAGPAPASTTSTPAKGDVGGYFYKMDTCIYPNPKTGSCSCPDGFKSYSLIGGYLFGGGDANRFNHVCLGELPLY